MCENQNVNSYGKQIDATKQKYEVLTATNTKTIKQDNIYYFINQQLGDRASLRTTIKLNKSK